MVRFTKRRGRRGRRNISKKTRGGYLSINTEEDRDRHYEEYAEALVDLIYERKTVYEENKNTEMELLRLQLKRDTFLHFKEAIDTMIADNFSIKNKIISYPLQNNLKEYIQRMIDLTPLNYDAALHNFLTRAYYLTRKFSPSEFLKLNGLEKKINTISQYNFHFGKRRFLLVLERRISNTIKTINEHISQLETRLPLFSMGKVEEATNRITDRMKSASSAAKSKLMDWMHLQPNDVEK
jgi:hypothetical protein